MDIRDFTPAFADVHARQAFIAQTVDAAIAKRITSSPDRRLRDCLWSIETFDELANDLYARVESKPYHEMWERGKSRVYNDICISRPDAIYFSKFRSLVIQGYTAAAYTVNKRRFPAAAVLQSLRAFVTIRNIPQPVSMGFEIYTDKFGIPRNDAAFLVYANWLDIPLPSMRKTVYDID